MPFVLTKGRFKPLSGTPDGDSVRFLAKNINLWKKLEGKSVRFGTSAKTKNTVQLRFEGIDAIEKRAIKPLSTEAKENMLRLIGFDEAHPEPSGYVLSRMTDDAHGRPICFVFAGRTNLRDGSEIYLTSKMLRASVNYHQAKAGFAYPLYYSTLFASFRGVFNEAVAYAKKHRLGYWPHDHTVKGVTVRNHDDLATIAPIWPKLWRRLEEFLRHKTSLRGFKDFLEEKNERVDILPIMEERGLQDIVEVRGNKVRMTVRPENVRVVGKAGRRGR